MPSRLHSAAQTALILQFGEGRDRFNIHSELTLQIGDRCYTPDIAIFPKMNFDWLHDDIRVVEPPLMAVEILSPTQGSAKVMANIDAYFAHGVESCWLVTPPAKAVTVISRRGAQQTFTEGIVVDPATGLKADLSAVFP